MQACAKHRYEKTFGPKACGRLGKDEREIERPHQACRLQGVCMHVSETPLPLPVEMGERVLELGNSNRCELLFAINSPRAGKILETGVARIKS